MGLCVLTCARAWLSARTGVVGSVRMRVYVCVCVLSVCFVSACLAGSGCVFQVCVCVCVCVSHDPSTSKKVALHCTMHLAGPLSSTNQEW